MKCVEYEMQKRWTINQGKTNLHNKWKAKNNQEIKKWIWKNIENQRGNAQWWKNKRRTKERKNATKMASKQINTKNITTKWH